MKVTRFFALLVFLPSCTKAEEGANWISISGPDETVIRSEDFKCNSVTSDNNADAVLDVADAPPRAMRRSDGEVMLITAHYNNIPWYSKDMKNFYRKSCRSVLTLPENPSPAAFDDQGWIVGLYTKNGKDVFALVHNEYHGAAHIPECQKRLQKGQGYYAPICLQISMKGYISHDQGENFSPLAVDQPVLASTMDRILPKDYNKITRYGIHDPSNIVQNPVDGYYYFVSGVDPSPLQKSGLCVFRSADPLTKPWMAWGGKAFDAKMTSPYGGRGASCVPVKPWGTYIPALSYNTVLKRFIAIGRSDSHHLVALYSKDLINWGPEVRLRRSEQLNWWKPFTGAPDPDSYWSIIDPTSPSRFFATSGKNPYVYYVGWRTGLTRPLSRVRDIKRFRLVINPVIEPKSNDDDVKVSAH